MVKKKRCTLLGESFVFNEKMNCDKNGCTVETKVTEEHAWGQNLSKYAYRCSMHETSILAINIEESIFGSNNCVANDFKCTIDSRLLVWNNTVIHKCPYETISFAGNFSWDGGYLINMKTNLVLTPIKRLSACNFSIFETAEGLYGTLEPFQLLVQKGISIGKLEDYTNDILLANMDFEHMQTFRWIKWNDESTCMNTKNMILLYQQFDETYFRLSNKKKEDTVLYVKDGVIYIPQCNVVSKVNADVPRTCHKLQ
jgi:hypothetical protein